MKTIKVYAQHEENKKWLNNLSFYKDEIKVMENRLSEIASKNSAKEVLALVEHFQNQLLIQRDNIDELRHELTLSEDAIESGILENVTAVDHREIERNIGLTDRLETFEKNFNNNKTSLNIFLAKWM